MLTVQDLGAGKPRRSASPRKAPAQSRASGLRLTELVKSPGPQAKARAKRKRLSNVIASNAAFLKAGRGGGDDEEVVEETHAGLTAVDLSRSDEKQRAYYALVAQLKDEKTHMTKQLAQRQQRESQERCIREQRTRQRVRSSNSSSASPGFSPPSTTDAPPRYSRQRRHHQRADGSKPLRPIPSGVDDELASTLPRASASPQSLSAEEESRAAAARRDIFTPHADPEPLPLLSADPANTGGSPMPVDAADAKVDLLPELQPEQDEWPSAAFNLSDGSKMVVPSPSDPENVIASGALLPCLDFSSFSPPGELALDTPLPSLSTPGGSSSYLRLTGVRSRPGTRDSFLAGGRRSRPGTREALRQREDGGLSRPGTRESTRDASSAHERRPSRESTGEQRDGDLATERSGESFQMDMPSFRMTWSSGGFSNPLYPNEEQQHGKDLRARTRADRRRRDRQSFVLAKKHSYVHNHTPASQHQFFGASAKAEFFDLYTEQAQIWAHEGAPGGEELRQASARTHYLSSCVRTQSTPIPLVINSRTEHPVDEVDLSGFHMGDKAAIAWAGALGRMVSQGVELRRLRLKENSLSGPGMIAITAALAKCQQLKTLDLSMNDLSGDGGRALGTFLLSMPRDQLEKLQLSRCKLGDRNAKLIAEGLVGTLALRKLDLSWNGLGMGSVEGQRGQGAASAIATLLEARSCPLQSICLSYNQLLAKHAGRIASAFRHNQQLLILDLSWNSLSNDGVMHLADALRGNRSLTKLNLTHVEMKERGAMVIADVLKENKVLKEIILNENPIGQRGGRAILRAMRKLVQYGREKDIQMFGCNYSVQDPSEQLFDPEAPGGRYTLDLENPYERMVAWELVDLAWTEEGENWSEETLDEKEFQLDEPEPGEVWTRDDWQLPGDGILRVTYQATPRIKRFADVVEAEMLHKLLELMQHKMVTDYGLRLLKLASMEFWLTAEYAASLLALMRDSESRTEAVVAMLPRVVDTVNISRGLLDWLTISEYKATEKKLGSALFHFVQGNPTGHYKLQLGDRYERMLVNKLVAISSEETAYRKEHGMIDTSQKGDWENWRNETLNGAPYDFDERVASEGGLDYGILEFDYVSTNIDHRLIGVPPMPDQVFALFVHDLQQVKLAVRLNPEKRPKKRRKPKATSKAHNGGDRGGSGQGGFHSDLAQKPKRPRGSAMMQAAMADGSVDEEECRAIFRKFDADGSGELDTKELTGVIIQILKALQNKLCAAITRKNQANAFKDITAVQESFKAQIARYRSEEGIAELSAEFDPDSDGAISEEEFLAAFPDFLSSLMGGSPPSSPTAGQNRARLTDGARDKVLAEASPASDGRAAHAPEPEPQPEVGPEFQPQEHAEALGPAIEAGSGTNAMPSKSEEDAASYFQRMWRGFKVRRSFNLASAAAELLKKQEDEFEARSQAAMASQQQPGSNEAGGTPTRDAETSESIDRSLLRSIQAQQHLTELRRRLKSNHRRHHRPCWFISNGNLEVQYDKVAQVEAEVARRQVLMIRRATHEWYFSSTQVKAIVEAVPIGRSGHYHRVEALVAIFSRITDMECVSFDRLLGHNGYDQDGNHVVSLEELEQCRTEPFPLLCERLGIANLFNPLCPEREYALNLRNHDEATVAQLLVILTAEPGENLMHETYNGMPFDVGVKWETKVPDIGIFCAVYNTPPGCASFALRLPLARKLLLGGRGRWRAVEEPLRNEVENPEDFEGGDETDYSGMTIDSDGSTVSKEAVEARLVSLEASKAARAAREQAREAERQRATVARTANTLKAMTAVSLKFVRKVRGIKPETKMPPPVPGMVNTAWARAPMTAAAKANHEAAERRSKAIAPIKEEVEEVAGVNEICM